MLDRATLCCAVLCHAQVCDEIVKWAMTTPTQVETLSEVVKMHNRLSSDALTYTVCGRFLPVPGSRVLLLGLFGLELAPYTHFTRHHT